MKKLEKLKKLVRGKWSVTYRPPQPQPTPLSSAEQNLAVEIHQTAEVVMRLQDLFDILRAVVQPLFSEQRELRQRVEELMAEVEALRPKKKKVARKGGKRGGSQKKQ